MGLLCRRLYTAPKIFLDTRLEPREPVLGFVALVLVVAVAFVTTALLALRTWRARGMVGELME